MPALALALLALAVVLGASGAAKAVDRRQTADAFEALRVPVPEKVGAWVLPYAELLLAVGLVTLRGWPLVATTATAVGLCVAYAVVVARALGFPEPVRCACFGRLGAGRVSRTTLARNLVLVGTAVLALAAAWSGESVWRLLTTDGSWVLVACVVATLSALVAAGPGAEPAPPPDATGVAVPYGQLVGETGMVTLRELTREGPVLLVFLSSGCGSCRRTGERLDGWAAELAGLAEVAAVYPYEPAQTGFDTAWYVQPDTNVSRVLEVAGTPAAVLLGAGPDVPAGPITGEDSVRRYVQQTITRLRPTPPGDTETR